MQAWSELRSLALTLCSLQHEEELWFLSTYFLVEPGTKDREGNSKLSGTS